MDADKIKKRILSNGMTAADAEQYYGLNAGQIRSWIHRGIRLRVTEYIKIGRDWWVWRPAIERILKEIERPIND